MNIPKKALALVLCFCLVLPLLPAAVFAAESQNSGGTRYETVPVQVNPLYAGVIQPEDIPLQPDLNSDRAYVTASNFVSESVAAEQVRGFLKDRTNSFTVYVFSYQMNTSEIASDVLAAACAHTGDPTEGDYLRWSWTTWGANCTREPGVGYYLHTITYSFTFTTTAQQEQEMNSAVDALLASLNVSAQSDYQKICTVYDYICNNVSYDHAHENDSSYNRMFSAYAALVDQTAVSHGYALLFYRLMLELGVDARVIPGDAGGPHAWNIVKLGDVYYNLDATWDAGKSDYGYFLRSSISFTGHVRQLEYTSTAFHTEFPIAEDDYIDGVPGVPEKIYTRGSCGVNASWTLDREGTLRVFGSGDTGHYSDNGGLDYYSPWTYWKDAIKALEVDEGITSLGTHTFSYSPNLTTVSLPGSLITIGERAFADCPCLASINLPNGLETIASCAFIRCRSLTEIHMPNTVTHMGENAFQECTSLEEVTLSNKLTKISAISFWNCTSLKEIYIHDGVTEIDLIAFQNCTSLETVRLPDTLQTIGASAFAQCGKLTGVKFPYGLKVIDVDAFRECTSLTSVTIPATAYYVGGFYGCKNLETAVLNGSGVIEKNAFAECSKLRTLEINGAVEEIHEYAFKNCVSLKEVTIPESVYSLDGFTGCTGLERVVLNNRGTMAVFAFSGCTQLRDVQINGNMYSIGMCAFSNCTSLKKIVFPDSITMLDWCSFSGCTALTEIVFRGNAPKIGDDAFSRVTATAYYPANDSTWAASVMQNYGGNITWVAGEGSVEEEIPQDPDVVFVAASLSLKGDIGLNYYAQLSHRIRSDSSAYMNFSGSGANRQVAIGAGVYDASDDSYRYSVALNAKNMGDEVTAQVYNANGAVGDSKTLSIKYYADYVINNSVKQSFVNLMKAMLNYGAAAQVNFGYDTNHLVNADMTEADRTLPASLNVGGYAHTWSGEENGIEITSASLLLQSETKIRIYFKVKSGYQISDFTFTIDATEVTPVQSGDEYYIEKANVAAKDLDTMYTFRLGNRQLVYCGLSYVNQVLTYSKDDKLINLAKALYCYNQAANAYFGA